MKKTSRSTNPTRVPKLNFKIKETWDFSDVYKKGVNDPAIDTDTAEIEALYADFAKKYANDNSYIQDENKLFVVLQDYMKLIADVGGIKPLFYLTYYKDIDTSNSKASAKTTQITERLTKAGNLILFFELNLSKISADKQKIILKDARFAPYSYFLEKNFNQAKYKLSEAEEKILALKGEVSHKMWVDAQKKLATSHTVKFKGKDLSLTQAFMMRKELPQKDRYALHDILANKFKEISFMAEAELNAVVNNKKIEDELRGAKAPYELTVVNYENDIETVENLVQTVNNNKKIAHKFFTAKAKIMGLKKVRMPDLNVSLSKIKKKVTFEESLETVYSAFAKADQFFADFLKEMVEQGRIDIYSRKGKRGGAYCTSTSKKLPIYILLNYDYSQDATMTLAHEMGHAIHSKLSFNQPDYYTDYTISVAEVASTFFEHIVFDHIFETLSEEEKVIALFNDVEENIGLIFRQTQFFNFEMNLHKAIADKGSISKEEMAAMYAKCAKDMTGPSLDIRETDGYYFSNVPHFRYFFYVYSYAYGQIISKALYAKYKKDPTFIEKVKDFMRAGGSMSPADIFKSIGVDTTSPDFFKEGIMQVQTDLDKAIKLAKKVGLM